ncbi:MAG TPA: DNA methyltransferase [Bryobacteraceae bacterium]|nr:DNA methyltransferase [Bryobacteraceae bacterium]
MADNNYLFYGDNLEVLRKHVKDETVDLCYIDPPFNSERDYNQIYNNVGEEDQAQAQAFTDTWVWDEMAIAGYDEIISNASGRFTPQIVELIKGLHGVLGLGSLFAYLISLTLRVTEIHRTLKTTGSFYLHCDPTASHYLKIILDAIFCPNGGDFKNEIIWKRTTARSDSHKWNHIHDILLFYTKSKTYTWKTQYMGYEDEYVDAFYDQVDENGDVYMSDNLTAPQKRGGFSGKPWRGIDPTSKGRHWALPKQFLDSLGITGGTVQSRLDKLDALGRVEWPDKENGVPRYKRYLKDMPGLAIQSIINDIPPIPRNSAERLGYPTQKPLALLERIIKASSNEGDVVMDTYCGCGTTIDAAQKNKRRWIGIDITYQSIAVVLQRLEDSYGKVFVETVMLGGIPRDMKSVHALANKKDDRLRKEFEKWAVLTYTNNRAVINEKKGADAGIDGTAYFKVGKKDNAKIIFQVKSGSVKRGDIATLRGDMERTEAALSVLLTLEEPTKPMVQEANAAGQYYHEEMGKSYDRISIVTIREIVEGHKRLEIPMSLEVLKAAQREIREVQLNLL